jgi:hypothetical protein
MKAEDKTTIYVTGDIAIDHFLITGNRSYYDSKEQTGTKAVIREGGSYVLFNLLFEFSRLSKTNIGKVTFGFKNGIFDKLPERFNSYQRISYHNSGKTGKWKISQMFGFGSLSGNFHYNESYVNNSISDILVIDDAAMDYGSFINKKAWPAFIKNRRLKKSEHPKLIIYKMTGQIGKGELWKNVVKYHSSKLITIVSIDDLRKQFLKVSEGISWEQTALDIVYELTCNKLFDVELLKSRFLIVTFQSDGAVLIERRPNDEYVYQLIFDPENMENEWEAGLQGNIVGKLSCFTSVFTSKLDLNKSNYNIEDAIKAGLYGVRKFHEAGYVPDKNGDLNIPFADIATVYNQDTFEYSQAFIPSPDNTPGYLDLNWSVLLNNYKKDEKLIPLYNIARRAAMYGVCELKNVPHATFGKLFTADRNETENFRNVKKIMENYVRYDKGKKPLSIGVFGPPGSGKSFSVKQIAVAVLGEEVSFFEFNLSQFAGPNDLIGAFHQVRDVVLKGKTPVVFWDEFDSKNYEWLQYLLAPMQDGKFQEGQISHPIGKSIFIFAGGTSYTMDNFGPVEPLDPANHQDELTKDEKKQYNAAFYNNLLEQYKKDSINFRLKKGPDFKSRLNSYLNVLGPNKRQYFDKLRWKWIDDDTDLFFPVRRALFLRAILKLFDDKKLNMEWGLINAFLKIDTFIHGARSLTQILEQLATNNKGRIISRSCLPSNKMLSLHIDTENLFEILNENTGFLGKSYDIAPDIHGVWMSTAQTKHFAYIRDFRFLPVFIKESNYAAAKRIPEVLAETGLIVVSGNSLSKLKTKKEYLDYLKKFGKGKNKKKRNIEIMAEKEHKHWREFYEENGWVYNENRDDSKKQHPCIKDYKSLSEDDKQKDRDQVEMYFDILSTAGFGIAVEE